MGFGLLFIGYFIAFLMSLNNYGFAFEIVGYAIMLSAIGKLSEYKRDLSRSVFPLFVMALCSVFEGFQQVASVLSIDLGVFSTETTFVISSISTVAALCFHILLLIPIRDIAKDAQDPLLPRRAYSAIGAASLACLLDFAVTIVGLFSTMETPSEALRVLMLGAMLIYIFYPIVVAFFIYSCYAKLCAPEDIEMPQRPSRFAFINKMREKQAEKQAEVEKVRQELMQKAKKDTETTAKSKKK